MGKLAKTNSRHDTFYECEQILLEKFIHSSLAVFF